jgi:hypothetical protein
MVIYPVMSALIVIITAACPFSAVAPPMNQALTCLIFGKVMMFSFL